MWIGVNNFVKRKSCLTDGGGTKRVFHLENQNGSHAEFRPFYRKMYGELVELTRMKLRGDIHSFTVMML